MLCQALPRPCLSNHKKWPYNNLYFKILRILKRLIVYAITVFRLGIFLSLHHFFHAFLSCFARDSDEIDTNRQRSATKDANSNPMAHIRFMPANIKKPRYKNLAAGKKCNTYEKILWFLFYSSSFWLSSYSLRRRFWTSVGTCWYSAYFIVKVPRPEVSELSEVE